MKVKFIFFTTLLCSILAFTTSCRDGKNTDISSAQNSSATTTGLLGVGTYTFNEFSFFQALDKVDSCGLQYVEIFPQQAIGGGLDGTMDYHMDSSIQRKILEKVAANGLTLIAYGVVTPNGESEWRKLFAFGKAMGIRTFTAEPDKKDLPFISTLCDEYEISVAIHNHPFPSKYWHPDSVLSAIKGLSPRLGACADIGHWVRSGLDPVASLKKVENHILHLHMKDLEPIDSKDTVKDYRDVHWGKGIANISGVIQELKRQQFKGMIAAEYEGNWENNVPDVTASIQYFRKTDKEQ